jgi:hypothetical protein
VPVGHQVRGQVEEAVVVQERRRGRDGHRVDDPDRERERA